MATNVTVLRVFTDANGRFGNLLGVVDAADVSPSDRQHIAAQLGYSETIFVDLPKPGSTTAGAHIFTPAVESAFVGHPTIGAAWWLRNRGTPVRSIRLPAGVVEVDHAGDLAIIRAFADRFEAHHQIAFAQTRVHQDARAFGSDEGGIARAGACQHADFNDDGLRLQLPAYSYAPSSR